MVVGTIFFKSSFFLKSQFIFTTFCPKLLITGSPRLMRISLLRFFKTFQKYLAYAFLSKLLPYCNFEAIFGQKVAVMKEISQKSLKQAKTLKKTHKTAKKQLQIFCCAFTREGKKSLIKIACFILNFLNVKSKPRHLFFG